MGGALFGIRPDLGVAETASALVGDATRSRGALSTARNMSITLDGEWLIAADPANTGRNQRWSARSASAGRRAGVPSIIQEVFPAYHSIAWYWREFPPIHPDNLGRFLLRFEAVDYLADVWVDGVHVGGQEGSETPFVLDAIEAMKSDAINLVASMLNPANDPIDDIVLKETPRRNKFVPFFSGASYDGGRIIG